MKSPCTLFIGMTLAASLALVPACDDKKPAAPTPVVSGTPKPDDHGHGHSHGGAAIDLGTATIGAFTVKATRDEGEIVAGKDAPIDLTVTAADESAARAVAVRFWIGSEDAKGSVKAKGEIEDPKEPNRWHTHAEIPNPIPAGAKLWVEVEDDKGAVAVGSFELKT